MTKHDHYVDVYTGGGGGNKGFDANSNFNTQTATYSAGNSESHNHILTIYTGNAINIPPFYVLTYIIRCA